MTIGSIANLRTRLSPQFQYLPPQFPNPQRYGNLAQRLEPDRLVQNTVIQRGADWLKQTGVQTRFQQLQALETIV